MSNIYELQTQVAYLDILKRYPTVNVLILVMENYVWLQIQHIMM
jgi:hypothetical protein